MLTFTILLIIVLGIIQGIRGGVAPAIASLVALVIIYSGMRFLPKGGDIDELSVAATGVQDSELPIGGTACYKVMLSEEKLK